MREEDNGELDKATFTTKQILGTHLNFQFAEEKDSSSVAVKRDGKLTILIFVAFPSCRNTEISFLGHLLRFCSVANSYD